MKRILMLCCAVLLLFQTVTFAYQMPIEEIGIGGLRLGCTPGYVKSLYGTPQKVEWDNGKVLHYTYTVPSALSVAFYGRGSLVEEDCVCIHIQVEDDSIATPSGFAVGTPYQDVLDMCGEVPPLIYQHNNGQPLYLYLCDQAQNAKIQFKTDDKGIITQIILYGSY